jgi:hypothetical protein
MDNHQAYNVSEMVKAGGARAIKQSAFTPVELAKQIQKMALIPETLKMPLRARKSCGRPDAVHDLADLVESFGRAPLMQTLTTNKNNRALALARRTGPRTESSFMKGVGTEYRHDPFRRHRRHRHVRHCRGDAQSGLFGAGQRHCRGLCDRRAAQAGHQGDDRP